MKNYTEIWKLFINRQNYKTKNSTNYEIIFIYARFNIYKYFDFGKKKSVFY